MHKHQRCYKKNTSWYPLVLSYLAVLITPMYVWCLCTGALVLLRTCIYKATPHFHKTAALRKKTKLLIDHFIMHTPATYRMVLGCIRILIGSDVSLQFGVFDNTVHAADPPGAVTCWSWTRTATHCCGKCLFC